MPLPHNVVRLLPAYITLYTHVRTLVAHVCWIVTVLTVLPLVGYRRLLPVRFPTVTRHTLRTDSYLPHTRTFGSGRYGYYAFTHYHVGPATTVTDVHTHTAVYLLPTRCRYFGCYLLLFPVPDLYPFITRLDGSRNVYHDTTPRPRTDLRCDATPHCQFS